MKQRILIMTNDGVLQTDLSRGLVQEGYRIESAEDEETGLLFTHTHSPDMVILDSGLPGEKWEVLCRRIHLSARLPILMLTGPGIQVDNCKGLDEMPDETLPKPFALQDLLPCVQDLLLHTGQPAVPAAISFLDLTLDSKSRQAMRGGRVIPLSAKEYDLLALFLCHPNQVLNRNVILDHVWGYDFSGESNVLDVYVRYLRGKMEANGDSRLIYTIRGEGFILKEPG